MNKQEYKHIRNLAWDLLIHAKITRLPVNIMSIAKIYDFQNCVDFAKSRYDNMLIVAEKILNLFGYNSDPDFAKHLTVRVLAPIIVLKELNIESPQKLQKFTELPEVLSIQRFERYQMLLQRNAFLISNMEIKVLNQFSSWIKSETNKF